MTNEFSKASTLAEGTGASLGERLLSKFQKSSKNEKTEEKKVEKKLEKEVNREINIEKASAKSVKKKIRKITKSKDSKFKIGENEKPVKIMSLMGLEQVGQCLVIEYEDDMIIVDAGMEFASDDNVLGADYIIPDITYIKQNIKKLRGILLTHGHLDHIGGLRDILPELNWPTIYTTPLTLGIVKKSFQSKEQINKIKHKIVNPDIDILKLGCFTIEFVHVNHNIPETMAMAIHTPKGLIFNTADFKVDFTPAIDKPADLTKIARIGNEGVKLYIGDSLGSGNKSIPKSEKEIGENLEKTIKSIDGRIVVATFASNVGRIIQLINAAIKNNRVIFLAGRSMINNVDICQELGYIKVPRGMIRKLDENIEQMPDNRTLVICTGAQGEEFSALARMARNEHPQIQLRETDTIMMSSSVIPGNELATSHMMDELVQKNVNVITNNDIDIHASGHGGEYDHKLFLNLTKAEYVLPYYMTAHHRYDHKKLAMSMGRDDDHVIMPNENGAVIEMYDNGIRIADEKVNLQTVLIDGKGKGHLSGEYVVQARKIMAHDGVLIITYKIDTDTKEIIGNIQIESRGFVYSSEVKKVHTLIVNFSRSEYYKILKQLEKKGIAMKNVNIKDVLKEIKKKLEDYTGENIGRTPMVITSFVYINRAGEKTESENKE